MILTGKTKEDFENYVLNKNLGHDSEVLISVYNQESLFINYNNIKETLLNALIIEWFDEIKHPKIQIVRIIWDIWSNSTLSYKESIIEAIKKANEIYNNKN